MSNTSSEFICEVVKVVELKKHPGADKLEIATIATTAGVAGYTCVVRKGDFKEGDLAEYFGIDCVIPLGSDCHEQFRFLDPTGTKTKHRVRAIRLRGLYSEGLLLPTRLASTLGDDLAVSYGIEKWVPVSERFNTGPTPPGTPKIKRINLGPDYSVLSLKKCPYTYEPGETVVVTEKLHGSNFRCAWLSSWFGKTFVVGSHHTVKSVTQKWWQKVLGFISRPKTWFSRRSKNHYYSKDVWTEAAHRLRLDDLTKNYPDYVFYGELVGPGIQQNYDYGLKETTVYFYDVYDLNNNRWCTDYETSCILADCDLLRPYVWYLGAYDDTLIKELAEGKSAVDGSTQKEGVVVSRFGHRQERCKAKVVSQGYLLQKDDRD